MKNRLPAGLLGSILKHIARMKQSSLYLRKFLFMNMVIKVNTTTDIFKG